MDRAEEPLGRLSGGKSQIGASPNYLPILALNLAGGGNIGRLKQSVALFEFVLTASRTIS